MNILNLSAQQFLKAADLKEKITGLHKELAVILGGNGAGMPSPFKTAKPVKKGGMSAAGRAKVAAAQKARWAKIKAAKPAVKTSSAAKPAKKKFTMSAAAKAKLSTLAKARWAKIKATGKKTL